VPPGLESHWPRMHTCHFCLGYDMDLCIQTCKSCGRITQKTGPPIPLPGLRRGWRRWKKKLDSGKVTKASTHIHHGKKAGMHRPKNSGTKRAQRHRDGHRLNPHAPRRMSLRELMIWGMIYHCFNHKTKNPSVVGWPSVPAVNL
jgi:hypothetical protein